GLLSANLGLRDLVDGATARVPYEDIEGSGGSGRHLVVAGVALGRGGLGADLHAVSGRAFGAGVQEVCVEVLNLVGVGELLAVVRRLSGLDGLAAVHGAGVERLVATAE